MNITIIMDHIGGGRWGAWAETTNDGEYVEDKYLGTFDSAYEAVCALEAYVDEWRDTLQPR